MHMYQDAQPENHLEQLTPVPTASTEADVQRKRMLIALGILLAALVAVVLKDWDFWFPPDGEMQEAVVRHRSKNVVTQPSTPAPAISVQRKPVKTAPAAPATPSAPLSATAQRAALPPLQVEVVAGNQHMGVPAKSNAIHVDVDTGAASPAQSATASASNATPGTGERVQLSPQATQNVTVSVPPDYPLLARQMKVQGAVSLQALISREGSIQELQILSGPGILATAAREAVKQWHFKPYLQNGQPVETQARITVNFTISTN